MLKQTIGMVVGFFLLSAVFWVIQKISPNIRGQKWMRRGFWADVAYYIFTPLVTKVITRSLIIIPALLLVVIMGVSVQELQDKQYKGFGPLSLQPLWLQGIEIFILGDFISYWMHRFFHTGRWWKFHAVHHSSQELDWLSSVRVHPVNDAATKLAQVFPLLFLGFNPFILAAYTPIITFYAIFLHANVNWDFGPLRSVIASPVFHRWHHTKEDEALDKNFAGFFPVFDMMFGTYYMPKGKYPTEFGIFEEMPDNIVGQLAFPFKDNAESTAPHSVDEKPTTAKTEQAI